MSHSSSRLEANQFSVNPRNLFLGSLVLVCRQIEFNLYFRRLPNNEILSQLTGLIHMLDEESKDKKLKNALQTIKSFRKNMNLIKNREQIEELFSEISSFLLKTYLKECGYATPKYGKSTLRVPKNE